MRGLLICSFAALSDTHTRFHAIPVLFRSPFAIASRSPSQTSRKPCFTHFAPAGSRPKYVFFDVDECLVMPATPFIDGLPGTDALVRKLVLCGETVHAALRRKMIEAYYSAPLTLVDAGTTAPAPRPSTSADSPSLWIAAPRRARPHNTVPPTPTPDARQACPGSSPTCAAAA